MERIKTIEIVHLHGGGATQWDVYSDKVVRIQSSWGGSDIKDNHYCDSKEAAIGLEDGIAEIREAISKRRYIKWLWKKEDSRPPIREFISRLTVEQQAATAKRAGAESCLATCKADPTLSECEIIHDDEYISFTYKGVVRCRAWILSSFGFASSVECEKNRVDRDLAHTAAQESKRAQEEVSRKQSGEICEINGIKYAVKNGVLSVPKWALPHLIGRGGERIKSAQRQYGFFKLIGVGSDPEPRKARATFL